MWETLVLWALGCDHTKKRSKNAEETKCETVKSVSYAYWTVHHLDI